MGQLFLMHCYESVRVCFCSNVQLFTILHSLIIRNTVVMMCVVSRES